MFISCRHTQQSQSIIQFINKLPRRTAPNNTIQLHITDYIETKYSTQISTGIKLRSGVYETVRCPSVCPCGGFAAAGPAGRRYGSIAAAAAGDCGQCAGAALLAYIGSRAQTYTHSVN